MNPYRRSWTDDGLLLPNPPREGLPTIHEEILKQHRRRLSGEAARKHGLNQKDFKSATTQAAPVTSKVRTHSDQLKCAFG